MNQNYKIAEIEGAKNFDLDIPSQSIEFLIYILNNEIQYPRLTDNIIKQMYGMGLTKYSNELKDNKNPYFKSMVDIGSFFKIFISDLQINNVFNKYFVENKEDSDKTKMQRADELLIGLTNTIDYLWEHGGISTIDMHVEEKLSELHEFIKNNNLHIYTLPTYHIYKNLKHLYDILWSKYSTYLDTAKHSFINFYSNNNSKKVIENIEVMRNIQPRQETLNSSIQESEKNKTTSIQPSRDKTFKKLIDGSDMIQLFQKYEELLINEGFLSEDREEWLENTASFMRFYNYCESKKVFKNFHKDYSTGVNMLRNLYNHHKGMNINNKKKRLKQSEVKRYLGQFDFLNNI